MRKYLLLGMIVSSNLLFAQHNNGFYGKKMFFDLSLRGAVPILSFSSYDYYKTSGTNGLIKSSDRFNFGYSGSFGIAFKRNAALSLNISNYHANIPGFSRFYFIQPNSNYFVGADVKHERLNVRTLMIMPVLHLASKNSLLPIGISHEIGLGYHITSVVEKDYTYIADPFTYSYYDEVGNYQNVSLNTTQSATAFIDSLQNANGSFIDYTKKYTGLSLSYAIKIRRPITNSIAINTGFRYTFHHTKLIDKYDDYGPNNNYKSDEIAPYLRLYHRWSIMTFDIGLTLLL